jgi:16S rRNA (uracil1498-N3)-methyltransferase
MTLRVFTSEALAAGGEIVLDREESHYLTRVRRAAVGEAIEVLDGRGSVHTAHVVTVDPHAARVHLGDPSCVPQPEPLELALGLPDPAATLEAVTLACEAGATVISLVRCERSHPAVPSGPRLHKVVRAALRQCGRPGPPTIRDPLDLDAWLAERDAGVFAWVSARDEVTPFPRLDHLDRRVLVGPEGGLTDDEARRAQARGLVPIGLGPWVLRTPTAVVAALTRVRFG